MNSVKKAYEQECGNYASAPTPIVLHRAIAARTTGSKSSVALSMIVASLGALWMIHSWHASYAFSIDNIFQGDTRHLVVAVWFVAGALVCGTGVLLATLLNRFSRVGTVLTLAACTLVCASLVGVFLSALLLVRPELLAVQAGIAGLLAATTLGCFGFAALVFRFRGGS